MVTIKTKAEIEILRESGRRLARILDELARAAVPGVTALEIDKLAHSLITKGGDTPTFLGHQGPKDKFPYPASTCISINDEVVHGLPTEKKLKAGDIVGIDVSLIHRGLITDTARTVGVGKIDEPARKLLQVTQESLMKGIGAAKAGKTTGDIGHAIETFIKLYKYGIVRELCGHGVGYKIHEDPYIPNYGKSGAGVELKPGMVIAIEPMVNEGGDAITVDADGFTIKTTDHTRSAHFEHTVVITEGAAEILTRI